MKKDFGSERFLKENWILTIKYEVLSSFEFLWVNRQGSHSKNNFGCSKRFKKI